MFRPKSRDLLKDAAVALDRLRLADVADLADDKHPVKTENPRFAEHLAQPSKWLADVGADGRMS